MFSYISITTFVLTVILSLGETVKDWDYMVFSQSWPSTTCTEWKDVSGTHECNLPKYTHWIVHGLWPTKNGTTGPFFCPGAEFSKDALASIEIELDEDWTNVEVPTERYSFWRHEWEKHGCCAASLPALNSEIKYFRQGIVMLDKFSITEILKDKGIVPGERLYSSEEIHNTVQSALGKVPSIHCFHERGSGKTFLHEIRICLDKNFEAIDCQGHDGHNFGNCGNPSEQVVQYPLPLAPKLREFSFTPPSPHWLYKAFYVLRLFNFLNVMY